MTEPAIELRGVTKRFSRRRRSAGGHWWRQERADKVALHPLDRPLRELSRGQQQKVAIARSLLTTPMLVLMDEPTTGLDPRSKREVQEMVTELREQRGVTVLLCTHDLEEAVTVCDRVIVMDRG